MSVSARVESVFQWGLLGLAGLGGGLVALGANLNATYGTPLPLAALVVASGLLLVGQVVWVMSSDAQVRFDRSFVATAGTAALLAAVGVAAALASLGTFSPRIDGGRAAFLAGVGANVGFAAEVQSAHIRAVARRADRAESTAERLFEERSRFAVLNETTRSLLRCPDAESVASTLVGEGRIGLPGPFAGVWLYDDDRGRLVPVSVKRTDPSWEAEQLWPDGEAMDAFEVGEPRLVADEQLPDLKEVYAVPMGDHGLLVVGADAMDDRARDLAEVYALTGQAALDRLEHERALERQNERLEAFASAVTHDLRNPLNVVDGRVDLARETGDLSHLDAVERAVDRMETIIEEVRELARGGEDAMVRESVQLSSVVETAWDSVPTPEATLELGFLPTVEGDAERLSRLFENLFRNAVEHGGEDVTVSVGSTDDGFYVADDGPGIPPEERDAVLDEGYSRSGGTGLGLAIVRQIAEAHGWSVAVKESEAGGAQFVFDT